MITALGSMYCTPDTPGYSDGEKTTTPNKIIEAMNNLAPITPAPFLIVDTSSNSVVGISTSERKPMYENEMTKAVGLIATCNGCDRIIFEDENWKEQYIDSHGYCRECCEEIEKVN